MTDHLDPVKLEAAAQALHDRNERLAGPLLKSLSDGQVSATERDCVETILRGYGVPELEAEVARLDTAARGLCAALSVWRPGQLTTPSDYPEWIYKAWGELADVLEPSNLTPPTDDRSEDGE